MHAAYPQETKLVTPKGYEGNVAKEDRASGVASYKKILLKTPCPGRDLPEDTCCLDLSGVTGLGPESGQNEFHPGDNQA
jgi:hypothetical protein